MLTGIKEACEFLNYPVVSGNVPFITEQIKKYLSYSSNRWYWLNSKII